MEKIAYTAPEIEDLGAFEEITQGASTGSAIDASFPVGTPFSQLTFS
ncbi:MAG: lasso RiPP family leader peptide-containing protein [Pseudomonadota bacterium]